MFFNTVAPELQVGVAGMPKVIESNKLASYELRHELDFWHVVRQT